MKKLYRSEQNKVWKGILGGIGEYYQIDPAILRIIFIGLLLVTGFFPFAVLYVIAIFVIPSSPVVHVRDSEVIHD